MKQADIKRLEKVINLYDKIVGALDKTYESLWKEEDEWISFKTCGDVMTRSLVKDLLDGARMQRSFVMTDLNVIKENCHDGV